MQGLPFKARESESLTSARLELSVGVRPKIFFSIFKFKKKKRRFLECSGPLDNVRTTPEWLKNNFKKIEKIVLFF